MDTLTILLALDLNGFYTCPQVLLSWPCISTDFSLKIIEKILVPCMSYGKIIPESWKFPPFKHSETYISITRTFTHREEDCLQMSFGYVCWFLLVYVVLFLRQDGGGGGDDVNHNTDSTLLAVCHALC